MADTKKEEVSLVNIYQWRLLVRGSQDAQELTGRNGESPLL